MTATKLARSVEYNTEVHTQPFAPSSFFCFREEPPGDSPHGHYSGYVHSNGVYAAKLHALPLISQRSELIALFNVAQTTV